jgi:outer membrane protein
MTLQISRASWTRVSGGALALAIVASGPPIKAQQSATPPARPPAQTTGAQGPVLPITMEDAVRMAREANLGLQSERMNLTAADEGIAGARSAFLPNLTASFNRQSSKVRPTNFTEGSSDITSLGLTTNTRVNQALPWFGGDYSVAWGSNRNTSSYVGASINPNLGTNLNLSFSQPLWRDLKVDGARANLETSQRQRTIADLNLESRTINTDVQVRNAYLNLVAAIESLKVAQLNLESSQEALRAAKARVSVGVSPELEIVNQDVNVLQNQATVINARAAIDSARDALRMLILEPSRPDFWTLELQPTDSVDVRQRPIDVDQAIATALANRIDIRTLKSQMEITDFNLSVSHNATLPGLDLGLNYSAAGSAGTFYEFAQGTPLTVLSTQTRAFSGALSDTFGGAYPTWSVGATFSYPLGRNAAQASYARALIGKRQQELQLRDLETQVVNEVRAAGRQVQTTYQRLEVLQAQLAATERQRIAEERRFAVGLSSALDLQNVQNQETAARNQELAARIQYLQALIRFDTVQKTR